VVRLAGGELTIDAIDARPVAIVTGDTTIAVREAKVKVIATGGVISTIRVFAGSVEVTVDGKRVVIEAGMVWERASARDEALAAFRAGWTALREARDADAVAAFDQATDATVAEDALYWSAIASERAADPAGAVQRYRALLARFPPTRRAPRSPGSRRSRRRRAPVRPAGPPAFAHGLPPGPDRAPCSRARYERASALAPGHPRERSKPRSLRRPAQARRSRAHGTADAPHRR
jgi:hypothetical protein